MSLMRSKTMNLYKILSIIKWKIKKMNKYSNIINKPLSLNNYKLNLSSNMKYAYKNINSLMI